MNKKNKITIIGMGYIGLPLAVEFSKYYKVIGYDINKKKIREINNNHKFKFEITNSINLIKESNIYIVAVPTPVFKNNKPDLKPLINASKLISKILKKNDLVIYESTVYPGTTDDLLIPILENYSKLKINVDFHCGYSPERLNPGSKFDDLKKIVKVTSGSNNFATNKVDKLYKKIIKIGTHKTSSIKVAEAAKVIENCQRDLNIAFINELYLIFNKLNINNYEILKAASTKWNFINFTPGLVGGHCIGVDPYYLTYISKKNNYDPRVILSGRKINDNMAVSVSKIFIQNLNKNKIKMKSSNILLLGFTFKENCDDIRNSKIADVYYYLKKKVRNIHIYDPIANKRQVKEHYNINLINVPKNKFYDGILILVKHDNFKNSEKIKIKNFAKNKCLIYDFKNLYNRRNHIFLSNDL